MPLTAFACKAIAATRWERIEATFAAAGASPRAAVRSLDRRGRRLAGGRRRRGDRPRGERREGCGAGDGGSGAGERAGRRHERICRMNEFSGDAWDQERLATGSKQRLALML